MKFTYDTHDKYLFDTKVENLFISEYMATAPGEYVKVYLYILMCAQMGEEASLDDMAKQLQTNEEEIKNAVRYWKERGALETNKLHGDENIEVLSFRSNFYGTKKQSKRSETLIENTESPLRDRKLSTLYGNIEKLIGRPLGAREPVQIMQWMDDYGATPEVILKAYEYCISTHKKDAAAYVGKVVKTWALKGLLDVRAVEEYLEENERMHFLYRRVFKALGFSRNATEEERRIMDIWFNEMNLSIDKVLEACRKTSGISNPNIKYIDTVIKNVHKKEAGAVPDENGEIAPGIVLKYYDYIREKEEAEAKTRTDEIYEKLPEIRELDKEIRKAGAEISRIMVSRRDNKKAAAAEIRSKVDGMLADKAAILTENGYPIDYMEVRHMCSICGDTGTTEDGQRCVCYKDRMDEAKKWQIPLRKKTKL